MMIGARIMRKFKDAENTYFGLFFPRIEQEDFQYLFQFLYGKAFDPSLRGNLAGRRAASVLDMS